MATRSSPRPAPRVRRRGDDIPPVSAYAHWNEDAQYMWYAENRYDMEHADEPIDDDDWHAEAEERNDRAEAAYERELEAAHESGGHVRARHRDCPDCDWTAPDLRV